MREQLNALALRYESMEAQLSDAAVYADVEKAAKLNRELAELAPLMEAYRAFLAAEAAEQEAETLLDDPEMGPLAREERDDARGRKAALWEELRRLLLPRDPGEGRNVILEIRSGVGGEEGALFARTLLRMYTMYVQRRGWRLETTLLNETELGGVRECGLLIEGPDAYRRLRFESGVHRVQRVPETESGGRIHTSAATVAVLPEAEEAEIAVDPKDLRIDTFRSSGAGGQHINKTESAIRITHLPTGIVVECQDERSQYKNRDKAMKVLRARLLQRERERSEAAEAAERRSQVGSGDRSERVRTYNYPQGRVTDHRIGLTLYQLPAVLDGNLDVIINPLLEADQAKKLNGENA